MERILQRWYDMISIRSVNGHEAQMADYVANVLRELGMDPHYSYFEEDTACERPSVWSVLDSGRHRRCVRPLEDRPVYPHGDRRQGLWPRRDGHEGRPRRDPGDADLLRRPSRRDQRQNFGLLRRRRGGPEQGHLSACGGGRHPRRLRHHGRVPLRQCGCRLPRPLQL